MKFLAKPLSMLKFAFVLFAGLLAFSQAQAQQITIGFVNFHRVQTEAPQLKQIDDKLNQEFEKRRNELRDLDARLNDAQDKYQKGAAMMTASDRARQERDLGEMAKDFQRKKREYQEDAGQRQNEEYVAFWSGKVAKAINDVATKDKLDLVVHEADYSSKRIDITDKVLAVLKAY